MVVSASMISSTLPNHLIFADQTKNLAVWVPPAGRATLPWKIAAGVALRCVAVVVTSKFSASKSSVAIANTFGAAR